MQQDSACTPCSLPSVVASGGDDTGNGDAALALRPALPGEHAELRLRVLLLPRESQGRACETGRLRGMAIACSSAAQPDGRRRSCCGVRWHRVAGSFVRRWWSKVASSPRYSGFIAAAKTDVDESKRMLCKQKKRLVALPLSQNSRPSCFSCCNTTTI